MLLFIGRRGCGIMYKNVYKHVAINFLHSNFSSYLLQLRDFKSSIIYPGHWGAFGGALEEGESPRIALSRELIEEIGYAPETFNYFREFSKDEYKLKIHMFYSNTSVSLNKLCLMEGADMGWFTTDEILSKKLYSKKFNNYFPMVPLLSELFDTFFEYIAENNKVSLEYNYKYDQEKKSLGT
jgi:NADH pyrophosphatase NudC (nudix superfamily)